MNLKIFAREKTGQGFLFSLLRFRDIRRLIGPVHPRVKIGIGFADCLVDFNAISGPRGTNPKTVGIDRVWKQSLLCFGHGGTSCENWKLSIVLTKVRALELSIL
jgi:hypothetical protein